MSKSPLGHDVLTAVHKRIRNLFDHFPRLYVSFSGGKDSSVLLHLVIAEAQRRKRKVGVLFVDLEAQYELTIEHVTEMFRQYAQWIEPYWVALPLSLRNAVSQYEPQWMCWDPEKRHAWVRLADPQAITDESYFPFFKRGMEFEEFVAAFDRWYAQDQLCAACIGIRTDESLNRYRSIASVRKASYKGLCWTTRRGEQAYSAYPLYDWRTEDIWIYNGKFRQPYNKLYDRMHQAGLSIHQARVCQPYGDDQAKSLWLFHVLEPDTWARVVQRVSGANYGALYARESGNITGRRSISKPYDISWQIYAHRLLASMPLPTAEHYKNKIAKFLHWYQSHGYPQGIPDDGPKSSRQVPSWARICKVLLSNDYVCWGLGFSQQRSSSSSRYQARMKKRREEWQLI